MNSDEGIKRLTTEIGEKLRQEANLEKSTRMLSLPDVLSDSPGVWHLRLELSYDPAATCDLIVQEDVAVGREQTDDTLAIFPSLNTEELGVSRRHMMLHPTSSVLYLVDLGSTNGTRINTRLLGKNIPHPLMNGDIVTLGRLEFVVRIMHMPRASNETKAHDLDAVLPIIIRAITTQLALDGVIKQAIEMTRLYTYADEVSVWLVDEMSSELFLAASQGMKGQKVTRLPVETTLAGKALRQGKAQRTNRRIDGDPVKLKTGYIAEGVIYVPLTLGEFQIGVISAVHRIPGRAFSDTDERTMIAIADLTATAIQNARLFQMTRQDLTRRSKVVAAFQYALSQNVKRQLHSIVGYATLLQTDRRLDEDILEMITNMARAGEGTLELVERLLSLAHLSLEPIVKRDPCDLVEIAGHVLETLNDDAVAKSITIQANVEGRPFQIRGDAQYLFYTFHSLIDNAIKFTPENGEIGLKLAFSPQGITITVTDTGPGIPEDELLDLFSRYFHTRPNDGSQNIGIGLEIVRTTIEAHMGTVNAHNRPTGGAEFTITLPASTRAEWPQGTGNLQ